MKVIETKSLYKSYGNYCVLRDVSFSVESGQLVGFLGPNGAGKSTMIRILMGLLSSTSGSAQIFEQPVDLAGKAIRERIGYLPGDVHLYSNLNGKHLLNYYARARKKDCLDEAFRLADVFDLDLSKNIRKFSTGMRQKLGLIQALMHQPELLILDEPTSALDPLIRVSVFEELKKFVSKGRTILFSSHSLDEVETLCDEVVILRTGKVVEQKSIKELQETALKRVQICFDEDVFELDIPENFKIFERTSSKLIGTWKGDVSLLVNWVKTHSINDIIIERPDLNDLFMSYYSGVERKDGV